MTNKYSGLSDFEVNKLIVEKLLNVNSIFIWTGNRYIQHQKVESEDINGSSVLVEYTFIGRNVTQNMNFCFDQSQAMSLMIDSKISLTPSVEDKTWIAAKVLNYKMSAFTVQNKNPCRAIAECFLLMNECKNDIEL